MKKRFGFIVALAAVAGVLAFGAQGMAYTVTGALSSSGFTNLSGSVSYTGTLAALFDTVGGEALYINNNLSTGKYNDMVANQDYVIATSSSGAIATFSVGEFTVGNTANTINITGNASAGYTVTSTDSAGNVYQSLSNVTNLKVVATSMPAGAGGYASSFAIQKNGVTAATYTSSNFPGSFATYTNQEAYGYTGNKYTGVSLLYLLQQAGVNTSNLNQYVIATGTDGGEAVLSMEEIVENAGSTINGVSGGDMVAYLLNGSGLSSTRGYARLVLPTDTSSARSIFTLASLNVVPTPVPPSLLLLVPSLLGLIGIKKRFM